jgi:hypothetical protein
VSQYIPPDPVKVISDDGSLTRIVEYANGAQAEQYFDVASETWINETDEVGNFITTQDEECVD